MKRQIKLILALLVIIISSACQKEDYESHYSNGKLITQKLSLKTINEVIVDAKCNVIIKQSENQKVSITVSENILNDINLSVINGVWFIDFKDDGIATYNSHEFTIIIESPNIQKLQMESSGSLISDGLLEFPNLRIDHQSSGSININCNVSSLSVNMDGSGTLSLKGNSITAHITHLSSGEINAFNHLINNCVILSDGSGDSKINVSSKLKSTLNGGGNIYYKGKPDIINTQEGSVQLINAN